MSPSNPAPTWESFLSRSRAWSHVPKPEHLQSLRPGAWHVVAVDAGEKGKFSLNAPGLEPSIQAEILKQCEVLGWSGQPTTLKTVVQATPWLLVVASSVGKTAAQRGRQLGLDAAEALRELPTAPAVVLVDAKDVNQLDVWEGLALGWGSTSTFKGTAAQKDAPPQHPSSIAFLGGKCSATHCAERATLIQGALLAKDLQDAPANWLDPARFVSIAQNLIPNGNGLSWEVIDRERMGQLGMGSFLSVAAGSERQAYLLILRIRGDDQLRSVALIGKGVTFDAGGINIKPSAGLEEMKYDMSGAANVLAAAHYLSQHRPPVNVVCAMPLVENLLSGKATRPGDIVTSYSGKTIEIINTDAEGRLILCDAISYVLEKDKPTDLYTMATLTGGVISALGHCGAAVLSDNESFIAHVRALADASGEPLWPLPLWPELKKEIKSKVADLANLPKPNVMASTIIGASFLAEFMQGPKTLRWAHIDIAGTAWSCSATGYPSSGGSTYGLRTLIAAALAPAAL